MNIGHFDHTIAYPLSYFGIEPSSLTAFHVDTLYTTWLAMGLLVIAVVLLRLFWFSTESLPYAMVEKAILYFGDMCVSSIGYFRYDYFVFIASLFTFSLFCCVVCLLPWVEEATRDINTTIALALSSYLFTVYKKITHDGFFGYLEEFLGPRQMPSIVIRIVMIPLEVMSHASKILSMSFRLFGNILGGAVVFSVVTGLPYLPQFLITGVFVIALSMTLSYFYPNTENRFILLLRKLEPIFFIVTFIQLFFGVFESLVQSFVISMLTMTYLGLMIEHHDDAEAKGAVW